MIETVEYVKVNKKIAKDTYRMDIYSDNTHKMKPGMFVNLKVDGYILRRPLSICSIEDYYYTLIYKVVGDGTEALSQVKEQASMNVLGPLGSPFTIHEDRDDILIIGGGVGIPPLYEVAKQYRKLGKNVNVVLGFNDQESIFLQEDFEGLGCQVYLSTMDGSVGTQGTVMDTIEAHDLDGFVYSCGPEVMLKAVESQFQDGYVSKEARMACGLGVCMSCVCRDNHEKDRYHRICKEGPVFAIGEVE